MSQAVSSRCVVLPTLSLYFYTYERDTWAIQVMLNVDILRPSEREIVSFWSDDSKTWLDALGPPTTWRAQRGVDTIRSAVLRNDGVGSSTLQLPGRTPFRVKLRVPEGTHRLVYGTWSADSFDCPRGDPPLICVFASRAEPESGLRGKDGVKGVTQHHWIRGNEPFFAGNEGVCLRAYDAGYDWRRRRRSHVLARTSHPWMSRYLLSEINPIILEGSHSFEGFWKFRLIHWNLHSSLAYKNLPIVVVTEEMKRTLDVGLVPRPEYGERLQRALNIYSELSVADRTEAFADPGLWGPLEFIGEGRQRFRAYHRVFTSSLQRLISSLARPHVSDLTTDGVARLHRSAKSISPPLVERAIPAVYQGRTWLGRLPVMRVLIVTRDMLVDPMRPDYTPRFAVCWLALPSAINSGSDRQTMFDVLERIRRARTPPIINPVVSSWDPEGSVVMNANSVVIPRPPIENPFPYMDAALLRVFKFLHNKFRNVLSQPGPGDGNITGLIFLLAVTLVTESAINESTPYGKPVVVDIFHLAEIVMMQLHVPIELGSHEPFTIWSARGLAEMTPVRRNTLAFALRVRRGLYGNRSGVTSLAGFCADGRLHNLGEYLKDREFVYNSDSGHPVHCLRGQARHGPNSAVNRFSPPSLGTSPPMAFYSTVIHSHARAFPRAVAFADSAMLQGFIRDRVRDVARGAGCEPRAPVTMHLPTPLIIARCVNDLSRVDDLPVSIKNLFYALYGGGDRRDVCNFFGISCLT